jgi:hypothetical protein
VVSFATVGWSPVWLLAAAADIVGGSQVYLRALVEDLRREGVLSPEVRVASAGELLAALEGTLGQAADTVDMPPLNTADMRASWTALRDQAVHLPDAGGLARLYSDLRGVAQREGMSIYATSSLIARGALRTGLAMGNEHVFVYYRQALDDIASEGWSTYVMRVSRPYRQAVQRHLDPRISSLTERWLERWRKRRKERAVSRTTRRKRSKRG